MKVNCFACGIEKDMDILESSEFNPDFGYTNQLRAPIFVLDVDGPNEFRQTLVCHTCFIKLDPDMWISKKCWDTLNPKIQYHKLPICVEGLRDPFILQIQISELDLFNIK